MKDAGVEKVFIATDGVDGEREELKEEFGDSVFFYNPTQEEEKKFKKGGVAIIDQDCISFQSIVVNCYSLMDYREDQICNCFCARKTVRKLEINAAYWTILAQPLRSQKRHKSENPP